MTVFSLFDIAFISSTQYLLVSSSVTASFPSTFLFYPMTYDLSDVATSSSLRKITTRGIIPNEGIFLNKQPTTSSAVSWLSGSSTLYVQFSSKGFNPSASATQTIFSLANDETDAEQKMLYQYINDTNANCGRYTFSTYSSSALITQQLNRNGWKFEGKNHASSSATTPWFIQGLYVKDADTIIYTAHQDNNKSRCFEVNKNTWALQRYFDFPSPYVHVASITSASNYGWWFSEFATGRIINVDLESSFTTGTASITQYYQITSSNLLSAITFFDSASTTLIAYTEYKTVTTSSTYIFDPTLISNSGSFNTTASIKRYINAVRSQGITWKSGSNYIYESSSDNDGQIFEIDIISFLDTGVDGSYIVSQSVSKNICPSSFPQDISFDEDGRLWCGAESNYTYTDDVDAFSSIWSTKWQKVIEETNVYSTYYDSGIVNLHLNGRPFKQISSSVLLNSQVFSIGGKRDSSGAFSCGVVKNLYMTPLMLSASQISSVANGTSSVYDTRSLNVINITLANPGAELNTASWTNETGSLGVRTGNPRPYNGTSYFFGGPNLTTSARQRFDIPSSSLWATKTGSIVTNWRQASFASVDKAGLVLVQRNHSTTSIVSNSSEIYSTKWVENTLGSLWEHRYFISNTVSSSALVDVIQRMERTAGTNNDGYIDDISASVVYWNDDEYFGV